MKNQFPHLRLRRLRDSANLRDLIRETELSINDFILPLFIKADLKEKIAVSSMPGVFQLGLHDLPDEISKIEQAGIKAVLLFGIPEKKDAQGSDSMHEHGIIAQAIKTIKKIAPNLLVIADTCFCEYTDHGHCGLIAEHNGKHYLDNDATLELLQAQALTQARAGADMIAPSGMIDGMVQAIRNCLDQNEFNHLPIMSYAAKYASSFYGPFREAAEGSPSFGDRKAYQMDPGNRFEALREVEQDVKEGADILMVKPAGAYLDVIADIKQQYPHIPLAAYQVSGEYAMIKAAAEKGWINEQAVALESLLAIKRAGANMIISYFSLDVARWLKAR